MTSLCRFVFWGFFSGMPGDVLKISSALRPRVGFTFIFRFFQFLTQRFFRAIPSFHANLTNREMTNTSKNIKKKKKRHGLAPTQPISSPHPRPPSLCIKLAYKETIHATSPGASSNPHPPPTHSATHCRNNFSLFRY